MNILVVSSEVPSIIWLKMQMWMAAKFQWFLDLLHKRLLGQEIYLIFKYVLDAATL
jgi:hypothetical protein